MAASYGFAEATLLAAEPPPDVALPRDYRTFDGAAPRLTYKTILAIRRVQLRQESLKELSEFDPDVTKPELPKYSRTGSPLEAGSLERKRINLAVSEQLRMNADQFWRALRFAVEAQGVSVYLEDFPTEDCRGVSLFVDGFPAILLSSNERRAAWKAFSLIHEYAHILIREPGISDQRSVSRSPVERYCNQFAAAFLLPKEAIEQVLKADATAPRAYDVHELAEASQRLNVSISTLSLRLEELGLVPSGTYARLKPMLTPVTIEGQNRGKFLSSTLC